MTYPTGLPTAKEEPDARVRIWMTRAIIAETKGRALLRAVDRIRDLSLESTRVILAEMEQELSEWQQEQPPE